MRIINLLQKNKPTEILYCLQSHTESRLINKINVLDAQMDDHMQLVHALQRQLYGELFDLFQIQAQPNYPPQSYCPMIVLGHWNGGQFL